jgi:hypothetical protein
MGVVSEERMCGDTASSFTKVQTPAMDVSQQKDKARTVYQGVNRRISAPQSDAMSLVYKKYGQ